MMTATPKTIFLKDYQAAPYAITHADLRVVLHETATDVYSRLTVKVVSGHAPLQLDGEGLELLSMQIDGVALTQEQWTYADNTLTLHAPPQQTFTLSIHQRCNPQANTALSGLYISSGVFCTQMEAEGFRRFAFFQDRPDVMATYHVRLEAPTSFPVLLSNGNPVSRGVMADEDLHFAEWDDPHPKPTYLFALVAGQLAAVHDSFTTMDGRKVALGIYVERGKEDRCDWAMECLKASMRWDEERFGRAYDLDVFNIVAVSDFNMGAMENKGLNIFNDKYILARPDTATDADYVNIERIIAHEYFHNWTGNRITCRDWFQLCLKEGLTVFRDQEFTSDLRSRAVKRIEDVKTLRARQFPEDQGPLTHPVRPSSYIEINNFYTPTVYEKGAELCRMLLTLIGRDAFRQAMDLFFQRHDGEAATVENFIHCMADASGRDLKHFSKWYEQAGTPIVDVNTRYDADAKEFSLSLKQKTPDSAGQTNKVPLHMPLALGLLDAAGHDVPLLLKENAVLKNGVFELTTGEATLTFRDVAQRPVLSINRGFSAPIILNSDATDADLLVQLAHDSDSFNRWEAAQTVARRLLVKAYHDGEVPDVRAFTHGLQNVLRDTQCDDAFKALMLQLPGEAELTNAIGKDVDASRLHTARRNLLQRVAVILSGDLRRALTALEERGSYKPDMEGTARRSLWLACLSLFAQCEPDIAVSIAQRAFASARNMTVEAGALGAVISTDLPTVDAMLETFHKRHAHDHLLLDKWFMMKAARPGAQISEVMQHPSFSLKTPNRVYALVGGFTSGNLAAFHAANGTGYDLLADLIMKLNTTNPQLASRVSTSFRSWKLYDAPRRSKAAPAMQRILDTPGLSQDVFEIISRTLA
jgi:aminopeptidase N